MSMADRDGWIWYDGKLVPWRDATTHVLTHTLHYGMGVFEGVRCYKTVDGPGDLAAEGPHAPVLQLGEDLRHEDPVRARGDRRGAEGMRAPQRARVVLHPAARLLRQQRDGRRGEVQSGPRGDRARGRGARISAPTASRKASA